MRSKKAMKDGLTLHCIKKKKTLSKNTFKNECKIKRYF